MTNGFMLSTTDKQYTDQYNDSRRIAEINLDFYSGEPHCFESVYLHSPPHVQNNVTKKCI